MRGKNALKNILIIFSAILTIFGFEINAAGQTPQPKFTVESTVDACELNSFYLDELISEAKRSKEKIFIISKLSKKEKYGINWFRLQSAQDYITTREIPVEQIVIAVGQRVSKEPGRLEFYLGSKLFLLSEGKINKLICLVCCRTPN